MGHSLNHYLSQPSIFFLMNEIDEVYIFTLVIYFLMNEFNKIWTFTCFRFNEKLIASLSKPPTHKDIEKIVV